MFETITQSLANNFQSLWINSVDFLPRFLGGIVLILIGWLFSKLIEYIVKKIMVKAGVDKLGERMGVPEIFSSWGLPPSLSQFVSRLIYFLIYFVFINSGIEILGLKAVSNALSELVAYAPNLLGAFIVFFGASVAAQMAKKTISQLCLSLNIEAGESLAGFAYFGIMLIGVILAMSQLKIQTDFLTQVIIIMLVTIGATIALSLGFGSRDVSKNLLSGVYLRETLTEGALIRVGNVEGELVSIRPVNFELKELSTGKSIFLPNSKLLECEIIQKEV